jgi:alpha,alpha-trehalase
MLEKPRALARKILIDRQERLDESRVLEARAYIADYWKELIRENTEDKDTLIGLPHPYVIPAKGSKDSTYAFEEQYYWDSYFMALGLTEPKYQPLVEGMLDNLLFLLKRFGLIPNASRMYFTSRSQPPLLTSYIFLVYDRYGKNKAWLADKMGHAQTEYQNVWMNDKHPNWHQVHKGLSRYYDINVLHDLAEAESGWDMTNRFDRKCLDFLPVDLNSLLYKYEADFARVAEILGEEKQKKQWLQKASKRKSAMDKLMWGKLRGFYFDYNFERKEQSGVWSLAAYYTMWAGLATPEQAKRLSDNLFRFRVKGGLTTTTRPIVDFSMFGSTKTQWTYPNGWAPLHYIVIEGLKRYGYDDRAKLLAERWIKTNANWFNKHRQFQEKYNVVQPHRLPLEGVYPNLTGFGWTNGVFEYLCQTYIDT